LPQGPSCRASPLLYSSGQVGAVASFEFTICPWQERKYGWFVDPSYSVSFSPVISSHSGWLLDCCTGFNRRSALVERFIVPLVLLAGCVVAEAALAKGGPLHLFVPRARPPTISQPVSPSEFLGGCGRGRYRDPATQKCRGPADVGIAIAMITRPSTSTERIKRQSVSTMPSSITWSVRLVDCSAKAKALAISVIKSP
jgi:hypothetical protein